MCNFISMNFFRNIRLANILKCQTYLIYMYILEWACYVHNNNHWIIVFLHVYNFMITYKSDEVFGVCLVCVSVRINSHENVCFFSLHFSEPVACWWIGWHRTNRWTGQCSGWRKYSQTSWWLHRGYSWTGDTTIRTCQPRFGQSHSGFDFGKTQKFSCTMRTHSYLYTLYLFLYYRELHRQANVLWTSKLV